MPRYVYTKPKPEAVRAKAGKIRVVRQGVWIDPYPDIPGTVPEKMVYAKLMRHGIPFEFQYWYHVNLPDLSSDQWYRPDFMIPDVKIIIEVQGAYWHTMADRIEKDSFRAALLQMSGWKVLFWWDYDIYSRLDQLFAEEPLLATHIESAALPPAPKFYDDLKALKSANAKRRKPWTYPSVRVKVKRRAKKARKAYNRGKGIF